MRFLCSAAVLGLTAIGGALCAATPAAAAGNKIMVFDFYFDNTSLEPTSAAESARLKTISDNLRADLQKSGNYDVISGSGTKLTSVPNFSQCADEQLAAAQKAGAAQAACGWVQKVSNLILNLNLVIEDVKTHKALKGGSVDIRGNTDESWNRGLAYLVKEHVFEAKSE
jgi:hypothetical protein